MCDCDNKKTLSLPSYLKIYTIMATYKINKNYEGLSSTMAGGVYVVWSSASQELLAKLYEEKGLTDIINKTTSNEESNTKKSNKKSESIKKDS